MARWLELDEIGGEAVGGKAGGLARLRAMGLRVPEAIVLVDAGSGPLPPGLEERVAALGPAVAVRSSALGEDGAEASFAGQYETLLDVRGPEALRAAIEACLGSLASGRATAYRAERDAEAAAASMPLVIQRMVDARVAGVCFTVDPVTSRRNRLVIDAVPGLGAALVSGEAEADHEEWLRGEHRWEASEPAGEAPVLSPTERETIAQQALEAERRAGQPLDLEWAIDGDGTLHWLQARPITTLGPDPQALDTPLPRPDDVFTRCNVGEMMPGAVSPLTYSTCARGIAEGWRRIKADVGLSEQGETPCPYVVMSHGHLFIDMSEGARVAVAVTGASPDQQSLALCGRLVPEVVAPPPPPLRVRLPRIVRQLWAVLRPATRMRRMQALIERGPIEPGPNALETWRRIDARMDDLFEAYQLHLVVSSAAGALTPILLGRLARGGEPSDEHHAIVAAVLTGAEDVESADIAAGAEGILDALMRAPERARELAALEVADAIAWLEGGVSGEAGALYREYLARHGHRSLRELDIRQPEWSHDPSPIVRSLQGQVRGRLAASSATGAPGAGAGAGASASEEGAVARGDGSADRAALPARPEGAARFDRIRGLAHRAVRNRERAKSLLVGLTADFKQAYRTLGRQLVEEDRLPDADAVYFLLHEELERVSSEPPGSALRDEALGRRDVLAWQETLRFPEVAVGRPQPERPAAAARTGASDRLLIGKPVSRGRVEGRVRVVHRLEEAEALEPGEILVAPITDVGWTPCFGIIAGLVTDVGSAVSHGAVVAREYGLPAVLNTREGTRVLRTGERVLLDGDRGTVERLDPA